MSYCFYGQNGEDYLLWQFFDFRQTGFFIDIGAHDGVSLSNTKSFEEKGWHGICVEPIPHVYDVCRASRAHVVNAACVGDERTEIELRVDRSGLFAGAQTDESLAKDKYREWDMGDPEFETLMVPAMRAAELITPTTPPIDFLTVDVEGSEIEVLKGFDLARNRPRVLVLEALTDPERDALDSYVGGFGYRRARSVYWNHFYVLTARDARKLRGITIDCHITVPSIEGFGAAIPNVERNGGSTAIAHVWSAPETRSGVEFVLGKLRQRYRRWTVGV